MEALIAIAVLVLLIGVAAWSGRTTPRSSSKDENADAARRYGL
jgi:hypothetical protein